MLVSDVPFFDIRKNLTTLALPMMFLFSLAILVSTNGVGSSGLVLALLWVLLRESELRNQWWRLAWPYLLVVLIYFCIMSTYAFSRTTALRDGGEVLKGISLSVVALYVIKLPEYHLRRVIEFIVIILSAITLGIVVFNLYQHPVVSFLHNREFDWYVNRNRLAVGFSITSIFLTVLMVDEQSRWKSIFYSMLWMLLGSATLLNGSRGAIMAMIVATICIMLSAIPEIGWKRVFRLDLWVLPLLISCSMISWVIFSKVDLNQYLLHDGKGVDTGRFGMWQAVSERIIQAPWFGYGPHAMKYDHMIEPSRVLYQDHPHSIYVGLVYASGIFGIMFWLIWFSSFSYRVRQNFSAKNKMSYYLGIGLLVNILVHGLVDFDFYMFAVFSYIIVGLMMILPKFSNQ